MNYRINVSKLINEGSNLRPLYEFLCVAHTTHEKAYEAFQRLKTAFPGPRFKVEISLEYATIRNLDANEISELPRNY